MDDDDLAGLVARVKSGNEAAVRELLLRFEDEVRMMVRVRLPRSLRSQFDSMDFVQAVWKSFFSGFGREPDRWVLSSWTRDEFDALELPDLGKNL